MSSGQFDLGLVKHAKTLHTLRTGTIVERQPEKPARRNPTPKPPSPSPPKCKLNPRTLSVSCVPHSVLLGSSESAWVLIRPRISQKLCSCKFVVWWSSFCSFYQWKLLNTWLPFCLNVADRRGSSKTKESKKQPIGVLTQRTKKQQPYIHNPVSLAIDRTPLVEETGDYECVIPIYEEFYHADCWHWHQFLLSPTLSNPRDSIKSPLCNGFFDQIAQFTTRNCISIWRYQSKS